MGVVDADRAWPVGSVELATAALVRLLSAFDDLVEAGSMASAKAAGKVRIEGKDYVMVDGDVVEFRFNV